MAEYRAYAVGIDGYIIGYEPLICMDDADAIEKATRLVAGHDIFGAAPDWSSALTASRLRQNRAARRLQKKFHKQSRTNAIADLQLKPGCSSP
jgi:hypothetical protein